MASVSRIYDRVTGPSLDTLHVTRLSPPLLRHSDDPSIVPVE